MARSIGSRWMKYYGPRGRDPADVAAAVAGYRRYMHNQRLSTGLSNPADEGMRGYADSTAGKKPGFDIGSVS